MEKSTAIKKHKGFTLIEVLLVIVVIGLMVAAIQVNFYSNKPQAKLEQEATRFAATFNLAAEYGLLNNIELGLYIDKNTYQFIGYDDLRWSPIPDGELLSVYQLPEEIKIELIFDDLPLEEPSLIDVDLFTPDDKTLEQMEEGLAEDKKPLIPQVYILSGGDITPFRLEFSFSDQLYTTDNIMFAISGLYSTPVKFSGPYYDGYQVDDDEN
jgi:general secretion pathway protein H